MILSTVRACGSVMSIRGYKVFWALMQPPPPLHTHCVYVTPVCLLTYNDNHLLYYDGCCYCFYSSSSSYRGCSVILWAAYNKLGTQRYQHLTVNHATVFFKGGRSSPLPHSPGLPYFISFHGVLVTSII